MAYLTVALLSVVAVLAYITSSVTVSACNDAVCGSLVSKCLLLKSCECDMSDKTNCTCCRPCHKCLSQLYTECCSCVGMCPTPKNAGTISPKTSTFEDLEEPMPELFDVLTEEADIDLRWTTYTYPAHHDLLYFKPGHKSGMEYKFIDENGKVHKVRHGHHMLASNSMNCTVAFMSQCTSQNKCKNSCTSMGAARFRWFHKHGCCECIGSTCLDFGKSEALCLRCLPSEDGVDDDSYDEDDEDDDDEDDDSYDE